MSSLLAKPVLRSLGKYSQAHILLNEQLDKAFIICKFFSFDGSRVLRALPGGI